mmetsp:Transcript_46716/g.105594  ORF Transcript_46716/g.105594 Transcript_46716/m.105594 type:complete len:210 (+) Transcript_46716:280-909(+)
MNESSASTFLNFVKSSRHSGPPGSRLLRGRTLKISGRFATTETFASSPKFCTRLRRPSSRSRARPTPSRGRGRWRNSRASSTPKPSRPSSPHKVGPRARSSFSSNQEPSRTRAWRSSTCTGTTARRTGPTCLRPGPLRPKAFRAKRAGWSCSCGRRRRWWWSTTRPPRSSATSPDTPATSCASRWTRAAPWARLRSAPRSTTRARAARP